MENIIYFGKNLTFLRNKKGLKLQEIGDLLGFSRSQWNNYECNTSFPKFLDLIKISKYFDISETDLIHVDLESAEVEPEKFDTKKEIPKEVFELLEERKYTIEILRKHLALLEAYMKEKKINVPYYDTDTDQLNYRKKDPDPGK